MYIDYFQLKQAPFSIAPDPRYLFMSDRHREALAHLLYGVESGGGVVLLTGEIGTGKTTVSRCLLEQVPSHCNIAYVFNPKLTVQELLESVCAEFHVTLPQDERRVRGTRASIEALNRFLLAEHAAGRNNVLVIDEAQNLSTDVLEQLRLLTNLETNERKLLQIVLIGQPELRTMLAQPNLEQLAQRVIAHTHLTALNEQETASYVQHRLATAGLCGPSPFQPQAMRHVHRLSGGVPRRINLLCDRALLGAYAEGTHKIDRRVVEHAASELFVNQRAAHATPHRNGRRMAIAGLATFATLGVGAVVMGNAGGMQESWNAIRATGAGGVEKVMMLASGKPVQAAEQTAIKETKPSEQNASAAAIEKNENSHENSKKNSKKNEIESASAEAMLPIVSASTAGGYAGIADERRALQELAVLWGWTEADGEVCAHKPAGPGLRCHQSAGGLAELRQLDRPAMLRLTDQAGKPYYAVLTALTESGARLQAGTTHQDVDLALLTRHFRGDFTTLWRAQAGAGETIVLGQHGDAVDWIGTQLARIHNTELPPARQPYNLELHRQVRLFQQAQGLAVDGVIGPLTFMHLNRVAGVSEPRLLPARAAE